MTTAALPAPLAEALPDVEPAPVAAPEMAAAPLAATASSAAAVADPLESSLPGLLLAAGSVAGMLGLRLRRRA